MRILLSWVLAVLGLMAFTTVFVPHPHERTPVTGWRRALENPVGAAFIPVFLGAAAWVRWKPRRA